MWYSYHIYSNHLPDLTINHVIRPIRDHLIESGLLDRYFFIRYSDEKGRHIRLRVFHSQHNSGNRILEVIKQFTKRYEDTRGEQLYIIEPTVYSQEVIRYGGVHGMEFAERIFQYSSDAVINHIGKVNQERNPGQVFNSALKYGLGMLIGFSLSKGEIIDFSHQYMNEWLQSTHARASLIPGAKVLKEEDLQARYLTDKPNTDFIINEIYNRLYSNVDVDDVLLMNWINTISSFKKELSENFHLLNISFSNGEAYQATPLWRMLSHYVHMNNNRFGITNEVEVYIAYLINSSLKINNSQIVSPQP